jgi:hypothetical protein
MASATQGIPLSGCASSPDLTKICPLNVYLSPTVQLKATSNSFEMRRDSEGRYFLGFARRSNSIGPMTIVIFAI